MFMDLNIFPLPRRGCERYRYSFSQPAVGSGIFIALRKGGGALNAAYAAFIPEQNIITRER